MDQKALKSHLAYLANSHGESALSPIELDYLKGRISYNQYIDNLYQQYVGNKFRFKKRPRKKDNL